MYIEREKDKERRETEKERKIRVTYSNFDRNFSLYDIQIMLSIFTTELSALTRNRLW